MAEPAWTPGQLAQFACVLEVAAPKAGNVHPGAAFADATWLDFVVSAAAAVPALDRAAASGVGAAVLDAVRVTRAATGTNTNLGMLLLLAPLCAVEPGRELRSGVAQVLANMDECNAAAVFEAIRLAKPGGLGRVEAGDVRGPDTLGLIEAMTLAAGRDAVARQYANGFADVLGELAPRLAESRRRGVPLSDAIVGLHLFQMTREPDSLIRRKCGDAVATESMTRAAAVLVAGGLGATDGRRLFRELDAWLRADGNRRNPGTSADLVAAAIFVCLREGSLPPPWRLAAAR